VRYHAAYITAAAAAAAPVVVAQDTVEQHQHLRDGRRCQAVCQGNQVTVKEGELDGMCIRLACAGNVLMYQSTVLGSCSIIAQHKLLAHSMPFKNGKHMLAKCGYMVVPAAPVYQIFCLLPRTLSIMLPDS
jgi:hypothetical protein